MNINTVDLDQIKQAAQIALIQKNPVTLEPGVIIDIINSLVDAYGDLARAETEIEDLTTTCSRGLADNNNLQDEVEDLELENAELRSLIEDGAP